MRTITVASALLNFVGVGWAQGLPSRATIVPPVAIISAPFSADKTTETLSTRLDGTQLTEVEQGRIYRDSQGRTRMEGFLDTSGAWRTLQISDPVSGYSYRVRAATSVAYRTKMPPVKAPTSASTLAPWVVRTQARGGAGALGVQTMAGFQVYGRRVTTPTGTMETWTSPILMTSLVSKMSNPTRQTTTTLTNVSLSEPNPRLFLVPSGYTVVDDN
jgi:hypothetical protein